MPANQQQRVTKNTSLRRLESALLLQMYELLEYDASREQNRELSSFETASLPSH